MNEEKYVSTPRRLPNKGVPSVKDVDTLNINPDSDEAEDLLRETPKIRGPRLDLQKPRMLKEAELIWFSDLLPSVKRSSLRDLFSNVLMSKDISLIDDLRSFFVENKIIGWRDKIITASVNEVYEGAVEIAKSNWKRSSKLYPIATQDKNTMYAHVTAFATVDVEDNGYYIKPYSSKYVNTNGDGWERDLVLNKGHTFLDGYNYLEHNQVPDLSQGHIVGYIFKDVGDAIYVDLLVAVRNKETKDGVKSGKLDKVSIGCSFEKIICSKCGKKFAPDDPRCNCLNNELRGTFIDKEGVERIVAELLNEKDSNCNFYEISWVANPAFKPAVLHDIL